MNNANGVCSICGKGNLYPHLGTNSVEYKGQSAELEFQFSLCDACGSEQSDASQLRANKRAMVAFKKRVDNLLAGAEVRRLRVKLGLRQAVAAQVFGGGPVAFSKYESDDVAQSDAMDKLLRLASELPAAFELLARRAGVEPVIVGESWKAVEDWIIEPSFREKSPRPKLRVVSTSMPSKNQKVKYAA